MSSGNDSDAYILANQVSASIGGTDIRHSDTAGPTAADDPRLEQQLSILRSRQLSQFSVAINGVRLAFWGEEAGWRGREVYVEHETIELGRHDERLTAFDWNDPAVATLLLANLGHAIDDVTINAGRLSIKFASGDLFAVEPDDHYESWQIDSDDGLLIVCTPGGDLTIWYPSR